MDSDLKIHPMAAALPTLPDYAVLSKAQLIAATGLSEDTLDRMHARGEAPPRVLLSARRIGYPVGKLRAWLETRSEDKTA